MKDSSLGVLLSLCAKRLEQIVNETLFSQIQKLFERTYAQVGINLEDCLIDRARCAQLSKLAGASARELSEWARTFLRHANDQLYVGIYYSRWLIEQLEHHDPRAGLNEANIRSLIMFVEEINHALHAALQFKTGQREIESEEFARNLELQAQVDTYLVLLLFVAFSARRKGFRGPTVAGCAFIFSRDKIPARFTTRTCVAVISRRPSSRRATQNFSTRSTACDDWKKSEFSARLITAQRKSAFSHCPGRWMSGILPDSARRCFQPAQVMRFQNRQARCLRSLRMTAETREICCNFAFQFVRAVSFH